MPRYGSFSFYFCEIKNSPTNGRFRNICIYLLHGNCEVVVWHIEETLVKSFAKGNRQFQKSSKDKLNRSCLDYSCKTISPRRGLLFICCLGVWRYLFGKMAMWLTLFSCVATNKGQKRSSRKPYRVGTNTNLNLSIMIYNQTRTANRVLLLMVEQKRFAPE